MKENPLLNLEAFGQSIWMDLIRRGTISGELKQLIEEDGLSGMTSNPSIFPSGLLTQVLFCALRSTSRSKKCQWLRQQNHLLLTLEYYKIEEAIRFGRSDQ